MFEEDGLKVTDARDLGDTWKSKSSSEENVIVTESSLEYGGNSISAEDISGVEISTSKELGGCTGWLKPFVYVGVVFIGITWIMNTKGLMFGLFGFAIALIGFLSLYYMAKNPVKYSLAVHLESNEKIVVEMFSKDKVEKLRSALREAMNAG